MGGLWREFHGFSSGHRVALQCACIDSSVSCWRARSSDDKSEVSRRCDDNDLCPTCRRDPSPTTRVLHERADAAIFRVRSRCGSSDRWRWSSFDEVGDATLDGATAPDSSDVKALDLASPAERSLNSASRPRSSGTRWEAVTRQARRLDLDSPSARGWNQAGIRIRKRKSRSPRRWRAASGGFAFPPCVFLPLSACSA
jgi:hypothetical protein